MPCDQESIYVYDERGEKIGTICGLTGMPSEENLTMTISGFIRNSGGSGGNIVIYLNGQVIATWDCLDRNGNLVPNSFYHFVLMGNLADGTEVLLETDAFVAPHQEQAVSLSARPNTANAGDTIQFSASYAGVPADGQSKIRIYTVAGELVRTITLSNGTVSWQLDTADGSPVASGVYLAVLDGINPTNGQKLVKITKVMVRH
jgi:hypothetical protein